MKLHLKGTDKLMNDKKIIIALFGAAGSGKDTIQKEIAKQSPFLFHEIISCAFTRYRGLISSNPS